MSWAVRVLAIDRRLIFVLVGLLPFLGLGALLIGWELAGPGPGDAKSS